MQELEKILEEIDEEMTEKEAIQALKLEGGLEITGKAKRVADFFAGLETAITALKEIQQYRAIGTVEECREAVEKQKPKAPKDSLKIKPVIDENGAYVDADVTVYLLCPNCGEMVGIDENVDKFCHECGQAIDTENLEGMEDE